MMPKCGGEHSEPLGVRLTRCYVPPPLDVGAELPLPERAAAHVARVLRARSGELLTLFDGRGGEYDATIVHIDRRGVRVRLDAHRAIERESALEVTLLQALARSERMDFIVQKATELGVAELVLYASARSVVRLDAEALARRCEHWRAVAISACEQCGRNRIPVIRSAPDLEAACAAAPPSGQRVLLSPQATRALPAVVTTLSAVTLLIGPEGGLSETEIAAAEQHRFEACRLGPRVLRAETAPLAALAALQALSGDFRA